MNAPRVALLALSLALGGCIAEVEPTDAEPTESREAAPSMPPPQHEDTDYRDPCTIGLVLDEDGKPLSIPTLCAAPIEIDPGDPPSELPQQSAQPPIGQ